MGYTQIEYLGILVLTILVASPFVVTFAEVRTQLLLDYPILVKVDNWAGAFVYQTLWTGTYVLIAFGFFNFWANHHGKDEYDFVMWFLFAGIIFLMTAPRLFIVNPYMGLLLSTFKVAAFAVASGYMFKHNVQKNGICLIVATGVMFMFWCIELYLAFVIGIRERANWKISRKRIVKLFGAGEPAETENEPLVRHHDKTIHSLTEYS